MRNAKGGAHRGGHGGHGYIGQLAIEQDGEDVKIPPHRAAKRTTNATQSA